VTVPTISIQDDTDDHSRGEWVLEMEKHGFVRVFRPNCKKSREPIEEPPPPLSGRTQVRGTECQRAAERGPSLSNTHTHTHEITRPFAFLLANKASADAADRCVGADLNGDPTAGADNGVVGAELNGATPAGAADRCVGAELNGDPTAGADNGVVVAELNGAPPAGADDCSVGAESNGATPAGADNCNVGAELNGAPSAGAAGRSGICPCCGDTRIIAKTFGQSSIALSIAANKDLRAQFTAAGIKCVDKGRAFKVCSGCQKMTSFSRNSTPGLCSLNGMTTKTRSNLNRSVRNM
jgi:hypothetical protein